MTYFLMGVAVTLIMLTVALLVWNQIMVEKIEKMLNEEAERTEGKNESDTYSSNTEAD
jgi:hypothetical protein